MKLSTKTVASLLVMTTVAAAVPGLSQIAIPRKKRDSQFDKLLGRHDRKGELRAEILGISPHEFKMQSRKMTFDEIIVAAGLHNKRVFRLALLGRLRDELLRRGWSRAKIDSYVALRMPRLSAQAA